MNIQRKTVRLKHYESLKIIQKKGENQNIGIEGKDKASGESVKLGKDLKLRKKNQFLLEIFPRQS